MPVDFGFLDDPLQMSALDISSSVVDFCRSHFGSRFDSELFSIKVTVVPSGDTALVEFAFERLHGSGYSIRFEFPPEIQAVDTGVSPST